MFMDDFRLLFGNVCIEIYKYLDRVCKDDFLLYIVCLIDMFCLFIDEIFVKLN